MNKKVMPKVTAAIAMLVMAAVMVIAVSYAWLTISTAPTVEGIKITLGGGTTILIAPNMSYEQDGVIYNYPGRFEPTLNFGNYKAYDYLENVDSLMPVSTTDGLHWFLPTHYTGTDEEVINGTAWAGQVKPIQDFKLDMDLEYANLVDNKKSYEGGYVYLDFWVVAPGADYDLRISRGDDQSGSYLVELMEPEKNADGTYSMKMTTGSVAASARVGFLVDHNVITDESILQYYRYTVGYESDYTKLRGSYAEPGNGILYGDYIFTVYEPNGDLHPTGTNGVYVPTRPVAWNAGPALGDVSDRVTVQLQNTWKTGLYADYLLEETLQTYMVAQKNMAEDKVHNAFYNEYLQGQLLPYINQGDFVTSTEALYQAAASGSVNTQGLETAGATDDIVIAHLEKNVPQRIRMFIWLEGQDVDCISGADNVTFALNIELAGSHTSYGKTEQED